MERNSIILYKSWVDATSHLSPEERGEALTAIIDYAVYGKRPKALSGAPLAIFTVVRPLIDANNTRYVNGKKGGSKNGVSNNPNGRRGTTEKLPLVDTEELPKTTIGSSDDHTSRTTEKLPAIKNIKYKNINNNLSIVHNIHNASSNADASDAVDFSSEDIERKSDESRKAKEIADYYNARIKETGARLRTCVRVNEFRRGLLLARLAEYGEEAVRHAIDIAMESIFLNCEASNAPVDLEWIVRPKNFPKVLEGKYSNDERRESQKVTNNHFKGEYNPSVYENDEENWR